MKKPFSTNTNKINETVVDMVRKQDELKFQYGIRMSGFSQANISMTPYDESNKTYKEYEEAELKANQFISQNQEIPTDLQQYLLDTKEERAKWHEYCKTHYRKPKGGIDMSKIFD